MTMIFFLFALLFAWQAWNLFYPNFVNPRMAVMTFLAGWLTGELALHVMFWQVLIVAFFVLIGAVSGFFGALGFLLCTSAWAAIAYFYYQSSLAHLEVESSLQLALGENFENQIPAELSDQFLTSPDVNLLRHPFRHRDPQVEVIKDIPFGDFGQRLDIRRGRNPGKAEKRPVLLQIHGGAWTQNYGSKNDQGLPLMNHMAKRDWICVATSYRLSPTATFPEHIIDCKQALVWIKDHIAEYGGDPDYIVTTGGSAGGHLSSLLALSANYAPFQPGFEDRDTTLQGAVPFYGVYDFTDSNGLEHNDAIIKMLADTILKLSPGDHEEEFKEASPYFHISEQAPPFLVIHGKLDTLVTAESARVFAKELEKVSKNEVAYLELSGAQHAFDVFPSLRSEYVKFGVEKFLAWNYSKHLKQLS